MLKPTLLKIVLHEKQSLCGPRFLFIPVMGDMNTFFCWEYVFLIRKRDLQLLTNAFMQSLIDDYGDSYETICRGPRNHSVFFVVLFFVFFHPTIRRMFFEKTRFAAAAELLTDAINNLCKIYSTARTRRRLSHSVFL